MVNQGLDLPVVLARQQVHQLSHLPAQQGEPVLVPPYELHHPVLLSQAGHAFTRHGHVGFATPHLCQVVQNYSSIETLGQ